MDSKYKDNHDTMFLSCSSPKGSVVSYCYCPGYLHKGPSCLSPCIGLEEEDAILVTFPLFLLGDGDCAKIVMTLAMLLNNHIYSGLLNTPLEEYCPIKTGRSQVSQRAGSASSWFTRLRPGTF